MYEKKINLLPLDPKYFKEDLICQTMKLNPNKPDINQVLNFLIYPEVLNVDVIETLEAVSEDGVRLTGTQLIVHIKLNEKLTYASTSKNNSVHGLHYEHYKSIAVVLPNEINNHSVVDLINCKKFKVSAYMEGHHIRLFNEREIFNCGLILVTVKFCI